MIELGVDAYAGIESFDAPGKMFGAKPCFIFQGDEWERSAVLMKLQNLFLDVWGARNMDKIALKGIDHALVVTAQDGKVFLRGYAIDFLKSGTNTPKVELIPMGPSIDFSLRRSQLASTDLEKQALRVPSILKPKKVKNVSTDMFGASIGRIHMEQQDFTKLELRKTKAMKVTKKMAKAEAAAAKGEDGDADMGDADVHAGSAASTAEESGSGAASGGKGQRGGRNAREAEAEEEDAAMSSKAAKSAGKEGMSGKKRKRSER